MGIIKEMMKRASYDLADIFRDNLDKIGKISPEKWKVVNALISCTNFSLKDTTAWRSCVSDIYEKALLRTKYLYPFLNPNEINIPL